MTAKDFIISSIKEMTNQFSGIEVRYTYDETADYNVIEVSPESIRRGNVDYVDFENQLRDDFHSLFPEDDLLICERSEVNDENQLIFESASKKVELQHSTSYSFHDANTSFHGDCNYSLAA